MKPIEILIPQCCPKTDLKKKFHEVFTKEMIESVNCSSMGVVFWELLLKLFISQNCDLCAKNSTGQSPVDMGLSREGTFTKALRELLTHIGEKELKKLVSKLMVSAFSRPLWPGGY